MNHRRVRRSPESSNVRTTNSPRRGHAPNTAAYVARLARAEVARLRGLLRQARQDVEDQEEIVFQLEGELCDRPDRAPAPFSTVDEAKFALCDQRSKVSRLRGAVTRIETRLAAATGAAALVAGSRRPGRSGAALAA